MYKNTENKTRRTLYISDDTIKKIDSACILDGSNNRSDFVENAVNYYCATLSIESSKKYVVSILSTLITAIIQESESKISRVLFKQAVELSKLSNMVAFMSEVDDDALDRLHKKCLNDVKSTNGVIKFEDNYKYQHDVSE